MAVDDAPDDLDPLFAALANGHRREIVRMVALQPCSISRLAILRGLSLPAISRHIRVLEDAGLVRRRKLGRTTFLTLDRASILEVQAWLGQFHAYWGHEAESLENYERFLSMDPVPRKERS